MGLAHHLRTGCQNKKYSFMATETLHPSEVQKKKLPWASKGGNNTDLQTASCESFWNSTHPSWRWLSRDYIKNKMTLPDFFLLEGSSWFETTCWDWGICLTTILILQKMILSQQRGVSYKLSHGSIIRTRNVLKPDDKASGWTEPRSNST